MTHTIQKPRHEGRRFDPSPGKIRYSRRWIGATVAGGVLTTAALATGRLKTTALLASIGATSLAYATLYEPRSPRLERITLNLPRLPLALDGLRIGQISDMHLGLRYTTENSRWAVHQMAAEEPDMLVFTGDFVSYEHAIAELPFVLEGLPKAPLGRFAVPGNHDYWEGVPEIKQILTDLDIEMLINEHRPVTIGKETLVVAGLDDMWDGVPDIEVTLQHAPPQSVRLLLAHCPDALDYIIRGQRIDVQLSGHTHGGHMRLPGLGSFCLPRFGWHYASGHFHVNETQLYVSRGLGGLPLRLGCPPEATIFTLQRGSA